MKPVAGIIRKEKVKLSLEKLPRPLVLNPVSLEDDEWLNEIIGQEEFAEGLKKAEMSKVLPFLWQLLDDDSKEFVISIRLYKFEKDKEGQMVKVPAVYEEPWQKLKALICGAKEIVEVYAAIGLARQNSNPDFLGIQKKSPKVDNLSPSNNATTSSQPSTDSPQNSSTN